jgi:hypothetical protein
MVTIGGQTYDVNGTTPILATFDFSADPIPVNATDLFVQMVYRGNMGDTVGSVPMIEPDAIAVGTVDVSEPTDVFVLDGTDYFLDGHTWYTPAQAQSIVPPGTDVSSSPFAKIQVCIDGHLVLAKGDGVNQTTFVPPTDSVRFAGLFDTTAYHYPLVAANYWENNALQPRFVLRDPYALPIRTAQAAFENDPGNGTGNGAGAYAPDRLVYARGEVLGFYTLNVIKYYFPDGTGTVFPLYPLPAGSNGYLPLQADAVYLNNPNASVCM